MLVDELGGVTSQLIRLKLDAILRHQEVVANNIANVETVGYSLKTYDFETQLSEYYDQLSGSFNEEGFSQDLQQLKNKLQSADSISEHHGKEVDVDNQMVRLMENVLHYRTLLEASSKRGDIIRLAINGGRSQ